VKQMLEGSSHTLPSVTFLFDSFMKQLAGVSADTAKIAQAQTEHHSESEVESDANDSDEDTHDHHHHHHHGISGLSNHDNSAIQEHGHHHQHEHEDLLATVSLRQLLNDDHAAVKKVARVFNSSQPQGL
jgi:ABC-type nickel/cobalt efflux system permease component RcnA